MSRTRRWLWMSRCVLPWSVVLGLAACPLASANTWTGPAISQPHGGWTFVPAETLQAWMEECIKQNQVHNPPGNPGPFMHGYHSIVILDGQCFSRGIYSILGMGTNIVIGAAANWHKEANWKNPDPADTTKASWLWISRLVQELKSNPNRTIKSVLDAVKTANPDPPADIPDPDFTDGGDTVTLGNPQNNSGLSYHAVIYAGRLSDKGSPEKESENAATRKAVNDMKDVLTTNCKIPAANIRTVYPPATWDSLETEVKDSWLNMNDNEQFVLVLADHSNIVSEVKQMAYVEPLPDEQEGEIPTEDYSVLPGAINPELFVEPDYALVPATVRLNGVPIGALEVSPVPTRQTLPFPRALLAPLGQPNVIDIEAGPANVYIPRAGIGTGPVAGEVYETPLPLMNPLTAVVSALLCLGAGAVAVRRRRGAWAA